MALTYNNEPVKWTNEGTAPSDNLKTNGFQAGYKPPAAVFNNQWHVTGECIDELQDKLSAENTARTTAETATQAKFDALPVKSLAGQSVQPTYGTTVTAGNRATIVGDVRGRTFSSGGAIVSTGSVASGTGSVAIGTGATATGNNSIAMAENSLAVGSGSIAIGNRVKTTGAYSVAIGGGRVNDYVPLASGNMAIAIGFPTEASGDTSIAMGYRTTASGNKSTAMGYDTTASGDFSTAMGYDTTASAGFSIAMGAYTTASGNIATAMGYKNTALANQLKAGHFAKDGTAGETAGTTGDAFIIGNGTEATAANCFRVGYDGYVYGGKTFAANAADVAELYEWQDGNPNNEDRRGLFVTLDGTKIKLASPTDTYIKGVISALPCLVGDAYSDEWQGKYLKDVFGVPLTHTVHYDAKYEERETIDPETGETITETVCIREAYDAEEYILNPDYDPTKEYVPREQRPEFDYVSNWGKLVLVDDGTCEVNGFATVGNGGKATKADKQTAYRVMERRDDTHIYVSVG